MQPQAPANQKQGLHFKVFALMNRLNVEANPVNFELLHEIISGSNPELRERFSKLGKNISQSEIDTLAREYLPHHFGDSIFDKSATTMQGDLEGLMESLEQSRKELDDYAVKLSQSSDKFRSIDPTDADAIKSELDGLATITDRQKANSIATIGTLNSKLESVRTMRAEVDEFQAAKFTHAASGLGNRRAFNKRMAALYAEEKFPGEYSLIFGKIGNFKQLDRGEYIKVKEALTAHIGKSVLAITSEDDFGAWIDEPQIAILLNTAGDSEVERLSGQVASQIRKALKNVNNLAPHLPPIQFTVVFGASTTYSAQNAASLIENTEKALESAEKNNSVETVIFGKTSSTAEKGKDYTLYNEKYF